MSISDKFDDNIGMEQLANIPIDTVEPNRIIRGEVVTIDEDFAYVNVGIKTDGRVYLNEFNVSPQIGDVIDVMLVSKRLMDGMYVFSKSAADNEVKWARFLETYKQGIEKIEGHLQSSNEKGFVMNCNDVNGFLPFSLAGDLRGKKNLNSGSTFWFKIVSIDPKRRSILLSRKDYIEEENNKCWDSFTAKYKIGDKIQGKVKKLVEFGSFVEVDGIDALLHKNDMSWKKVFKPKKLLNIDEVKEFVILNIDRNEGRISLGLKQLEEDPWLRIDEKYKIGDVIEGEVVTLTNFGLFVEIEDGVDGFMDASEISWTKRSSAKDVFTKGQKIQAKILDIKKDEKKIPLGYKQLTQNPWETIKDRFPVGTVRSSKIKKVMNFGIFVEIEDGIDGLVHVSDITWDENMKNPASKYKAGDIVEYKILDVKKDEMKIACGMKQLMKSPWEIINEKYPSGSRVPGTVSGIMPFGMFVRIDENIEGLVHVSEVSHKRIENLADQYKVGDPVNVEILGTDIERKRLSLSMKKYEANVEKEELHKLLNNTSPKTVTLGDYIKIKLGE